LKRRAKREQELHELTRARRFSHRRLSPFLSLFQNSEKPDS